MIPVQAPKVDKTIVHRVIRPCRWISAITSDSLSLILSPLLCQISRVKLFKLRIVLLYGFLLFYLLLSVNALNDGCFIFSELLCNT